MNATPLESPKETFNSEGQGIRGHLKLVCALDSRRIPILREQSFRAPIHLSKPHLDQGTLVLNVVNPTAGLLQDDRILQDVSVETGGRLLLTTPSASRAHRVREGWAEVRQFFHVAPGAFLEVLPEMFIPQSGAAYRQDTRIQVEPGGSLLFFENIAPGRLASGESFKYAQLDWRTDVFLGADFLARERYRIEPDSAAVRSLRRRFSNAYYGSLLAIDTRLTPDLDCWKAILNLQSEILWIGVSNLHSSGAWSLKWLSNSAVQTRFAQDKIRSFLYSATKAAAPDLRRVCGR